MTGWGWAIGRLLLSLGVVIMAGNLASIGAYCVGRALISTAGFGMSVFVEMGEALKNSSLVLAIWIMVLSRGRGRSIRTLFHSALTSMIGSIEECSICLSG